jgi:hypothetical protein
MHYPEQELSKKFLKQLNGLKITLKRKIKGNYKFSNIYVSTKEDKYTLFQGLRFKAVADYTYHNGMALFYGVASNESNMY